MLIVFTNDNVLLWWHKNAVLMKDVLGCILNCLPEEYWYKLKFNHKILGLM